METSSSKIHKQDFKTPAPKLTLGQKIMRFFRDLMMIFITGGILYFFDVYNVMLHSQRIIRWLMYVSFVSHGLGVCGGLYMTWVIAKTDPDFENCDGVIKKTTAAFVTGTVLWTIALWPVFHFWTLLLGVCCLFFVVTAVSMVSVERKKDPRYDQ